ncbi:MAG: hypothetical protein ACP5IE_00560 [Infirmifilum sp.]
MVAWDKRYGIENVTNAREILGLLTIAKSYGKLTPGDSPNKLRDDASINLV